MTSSDKTDSASSLALLNCLACVISGLFYFNGRVYCRQFGFKLCTEFIDFNREKRKTKANLMTNNKLLAFKKYLAEIIV